MINIKEIAKNDTHLRNAIEDYFTYIKDSNIALVTVQHLLFLKHDIKMDLNDIIEEIK